MENSVDIITAPNGLNSDIWPQQSSINRFVGSTPELNTQVNKDRYGFEDHCNLAIVSVAEHFSVPRERLLCTTRDNAKAARARQIAMYIAHTMSSVSYRDAAKFFKRDRTTIAHACKTIEDQRDDPEFDAKLVLVEDLVEQATRFYAAEDNETDQELCLNPICESQE